MTVAPLVFIATVLCTFVLSFFIMTFILIFHSHWHSHVNFYLQFSYLMRWCKYDNASNDWWYLCIVLLRDITQNRTDRNIANFRVLLFFLKRTRVRRLFFFSSVWQLYFRDFIFEIWIESILPKKKCYCEEGISAPMTLWNNFYLPWFQKVGKSQNFHW